MKTLHGSYAAKLNEENVLEIANQNKQKFESNGDLIGSYVHKIHLEERHMFRDDYSLDNMDFDLETDNVQINNKIDCNGILQQIASLQVDDNDFRTSVQSLNNKPRDTSNLVCDWAIKNIEF